MAAAYLLGILCVFGFVQGGLFNNEPVFIEDLRSADPTWGSSRIVSGWSADEGQIPFQTSLRMVSAVGSVGSCGGSLIHHKWIITAAHCLVNRVTLVVRLGLTNLTRPDIILESSDIYIHPLYDQIVAGVQTHDIGLLGLNEFIEYNNRIQPARLQNTAQKDINYSGVTMVVSGYGRTADWWLGGEPSEILLWTLQRAVSNEECLTWYPYSRVIREQTICAGYYNDTSQSICMGDSGGPLTYIDEDGQRTMAGIASFGASRGCHALHPSGFVRPGYYHDWYTEVTGLDFDWVAPSLPKVEDE